MSRRLLLLEILLLLALGAWIAFTFTDREPRPPGAIDLKVQLPDARDRVWLLREDDGRFVYRLQPHDGEPVMLDADAFTRRLYAAQSSRGWLEVLLNVSSPVGFAWVTLGLLGQVLFTGRMLVQWLASERQRRSVVPPAFWWMSLLGASMLLIYFLWRRDPVGVLGQGVGWFVYVRNLWLIHGERRAVSVAADPGPEPELGRSR